MSKLVRRWRWFGRFWRFFFDLAPIILL